MRLLPSRQLTPRMKKLHLPVLYIEFKSSKISTSIGGALSRVWWRKGPLIDLISIRKPTCRFLRSPGLSFSLPFLREIKRGGDSEDTVMPVGIASGKRSPQPRSIVRNSPLFAQQISLNSPKISRLDLIPANMGVSIKRYIWHQLL